MECTRQFLRTLEACLTALTRLRATALKTENIS